MALLLLLPATMLKAQTLNVDITDLRGGKGQIVTGVLKDSESYLKEEPFVNKIFEKKSVKDGKMTDQDLRHKGNEAKMVSQPFFSVVIATFHRAELLKRALKSLILQTEKDGKPLSLMTEARITRTN